MKKEKIYTIEDIYNLSEGERAELIDGKLYDMAPPSRRHQQISSYLHNEIYNYVKNKKGQCEVYAAPFAVFLGENNKNYVEPDISVICDKNKLTEHGCDGAPDWVIEIVSPSSRSMDYYKKLFQYRTAGVREYWVVDSDRKNVTVYNFEKDSMEEYLFADNIPAGIYEDFSIKIKV